MGWRHYHCSPLAMHEHDVGLEAKLLGSDFTKNSRFGLEMVGVSNVFNKT